MPAVTPEQPLTLPVIERPDGATSKPRPVRSVTTAPEGFEGLGFPVRRAFAGVAPALLDPFIHMDQMGEVDYAPGEPKGTPWHPHRGFETVTYMLDGVLLHQDSTGGGGRISDGATQWMTAGAGILHIETPPLDVVARGGLFHGIQLWVNLPATQKFAPPRYQDIDASDVVLLRSDDGGALVRIIAGSLAGHTGPGSTHTPIAVAHATVHAGAQLALPWPVAYNALVYALSGNGSVGAEQRPLRSGQLAIFGDGDHLVVTADTEPSAGSSDFDVLLLGGQPIREPVAAYGPFVMNTRDELVTAMDDYQAGRMGTVPPGAIGT